MSDYICFLITLFYRSAEVTLECALKVNTDRLSEDCITYPMKPEHKEYLHSLLPLHVRNRGPIVNIQQIFEISKT